MLLVGFLLIYITIISGSIFISSITNKKIETTIPVNMGMIILLLYLFGIFNILLQGVYIVVSINIILGIIALIIKKKKILDLIFTPGFAFFSIMYIILMGTTFNKALVDYDHFLYRSLNTEMMYYTNSITKEYVRLYEPASTLIQYFFMKMICCYVQGVEAFAMQLFGMSLLLPMYENIKKSKLAKIVIGLTILFLPAIFANLVFYESAYPDATIGLLFSFIVYTYFSNSNLKYKLLATGILSAVMVLTKPVGIIMMLIIVCMFGIYEILKNKYYKKGNIKQILKNKNIRVILIILSVSILIFLSWRIVIKTSEKVENGQIVEMVNENSKENIVQGLVAAITGNTNEKNNNSARALQSYINEIYTTKGFTYPIKMSLIISSIVIIIGYVIYYYNYKDEKFKNQAIVVIIGLILYIAFLAIRDCASKAIIHFGLDRYYPTILLGTLSVLFLIIANDLSKKEYKAKPYIIILLIMSLITPIGSVLNATITSGIYNINSQEYINNAKNRAVKINNYVEENSKIISITQIEENEVFNVMIRYYLYPEHETVYFNKLDSEQQIVNIINKKEYEYIYILWKNEKLEEIFNNIFSNDIKLKDETLYKINYNDDGNMQLLEKIHIDKNL